MAITFTKFDWILNLTVVALLTINSVPFPCLIKSAVAWMYFYT